MLDAHPDARLLSSTDVTAYNRFPIETAQRAGIRPPGTQHGIPGEPTGHSTVRVDMLAVWGTATEPWYRALGLGLRLRFKRDHERGNAGGGVPVQDREVLAEFGARSQPLPINRPRHAQSLELLV